MDSLGWLETPSGKDFSKSFVVLIQELNEIGVYQFQNDIFKEITYEDLVSYVNTEGHPNHGIFQSIMSTVEYDEYTKIFPRVFDYYLSFCNYSVELLRQVTPQSGLGFGQKIDDFSEVETSFKLIKTRLFTPRIPCHGKINDTMAKMFLEFQSDPKLHAEEKFVSIVRMISCDERFSKISNNELIDLATRSARLESMHRSRNSTAILKQLNLLEWQHYEKVNCSYDEDSGLSSAISTTEALQNWESDEYSRILEINGLGGYGKTALMYHYLRESTKSNGKYQSYDDYFVLTAKTEAQGEFETEYRERKYGKKIRSARDQNYALGEFLSELKFESFIEHICSYYSVPNSEDEALKSLSENKVLVVLDNYEDVDIDDRTKYNKFFRKFNHQHNSRMIVTGREHNQASRSVVLRIKELDTESASRLLGKRMEYFWQEKRLKSVPIITGFNECKNARRNIIGEVIDSISDETKHKVELQRGSRHPLVMFYLASILIDEEALKIIGWHESQSIREIIRNIVTHDELGIEGAALDWSEWVTRKAYMRISKDECCVKVIKFLFSNEGRSSQVEMDRYFTKIGMDGVKDSLIKLENSEVFIEISDTIIYLKPEAMKVLDLGDHYDESMTMQENFSDTAVTRHQRILEIAKEVENNDYKKLSEYLVGIQSSKLRSDFEIDCNTFSVMIEIMTNLIKKDEFDIFQATFDKLYLTILKHPVTKDDAYSSRILNLILKILRLKLSDANLSNLLTLISSLENLNEKDVAADNLAFVFNKLFHSDNRYEAKSSAEFLGICLVILLSHDRGIMGMKNKAIMKVLSFLKQSFAQDVLNRTIISKSNSINLNRLSKFLIEYSVYLDPWTNENYNFLVGLGAYPTCKEGNLVLYQMVAASDLDIENDDFFFYDVNGNEIEKSKIGIQNVSVQSISDYTGITRFRVIDNPIQSVNLDSKFENSEVRLYSMKSTDIESKIDYIQNNHVDIDEGDSSTKEKQIFGSNDGIEEFERKEIEKWFKKRGTKSTPGFPIDRSLSAEVILEVYGKYKKRFASRVERKVDHANNTKELMQYDSDLVSNYPNWSEHIKGLAWICGFVGAYHRSLNAKTLLKLVLIDTRKYVKRSNFPEAKSKIYVQYIEEWGEGVLEHISLVEDHVAGSDTADDGTKTRLNTFESAGSQWFEAIQKVNNGTGINNSGTEKVPPNNYQVRQKDDFSFANNHVYIELVLKGILRFMSSSKMNFSNFVKREWKKKYPHMGPNSKFSRLLEAISKHLKNSNLKFVDGFYIHSLMPKFRFESLENLAIQVLKFVYIEEEVIEDETELRYKWKD